MPAMTPATLSPRARDDLEELRQAVGEVQDLRDEEDEEGLREVAEDARDGEGHPGEVGVGVADELLMERGKFERFSFV